MPFTSLLWRYCCLWSFTFCPESDKSSFRFRWCKKTLSTREFWVHNPLLGTVHVPSKMGIFSLSNFFVLPIDVWAYWESLWFFTSILAIKLRENFQSRYIQISLGKFDETNSNWAAVGVFHLSLEEESGSPPRDRVALVHGDGAAFWDTEYVPGQWDTACYA